MQKESNLRFYGRLLGDMAANLISLSFVSTLGVEMKSGCESIQKQICKLVPAITRNNISFLGNDVTGDCDDIHLGSS
jgi:hypothetical protein